MITEARTTIGRPAPSPHESLSRPAAPRRRPLPAWIVALGLYLLAAAFLAFRLPDRPPFPYNWEDYTAWRLFSFWWTPESDPAGVFALTDGLMTDSGRGPLVGLPATVGFALGGVGLLPLRLPVALVAALAAPLLWAVGRRLASPGAAVVAALLLALSPVFLLYGRTATIVGVSLVPALVAALALARTLEATRRRERWRWLVALQLALVAAIYAYAPVRLVWPVALGVLALGAAGLGAPPDGTAGIGGGSGRRLRRPYRVMAGNPGPRPAAQPEQGPTAGPSRRWLLGAVVATALTVPAALVLIEVATAPDPDPGGALARYFWARGEQVLAFREDPAAYAYYLRPSPEDAGGTRGDAGDLARRLVAQNAGDLLRLLADRDTLPTATDHWNARGRLWPGALAPLFALGLLATAWRAVRRRDRRAWTLLALVAGLTFPLLLTSRVHVGRLVPALPFLLLLVAIGGAAAVGGARAAIERRRPRGAVRGSWVGTVGSVALLAIVAAATRAEEAVPIPSGREAQTVAALRDLAPLAAEHGGMALVEDPALGAEIERVRAANYRLALDRLYRFGDLDDPRPTRADDRPALRYGGVLGRLESGTMPDPCRPLYAVAPEIETAFLAALGPDGAPAGCAAPVAYLLLPP